MLAGDFNGDTKTDISCPAGANAFVAVSGSVRGKTDLLTNVDHALGGMTSITYKPGTDWGNTQNPPPSQLSFDNGSGVFNATRSTHPMAPGGPSVASVTVSDGRNGSATTTHLYASGLYDEQERRWLGFRNHRAVLPKLANETASPYVRSRFSQDIAAAGALEWQTSYDGDGNELSAVTSTIVTSGDGETEPYTARVTARASYLYDGSGTDCTENWPCPYGERRYQTFDYDAYGNRTEVRDYGNLDATDDETTTVYELYPNTSAYLVNRLARTTTFYGIGTLGAMLADTRVFYDGSSAYNASPSLGLQTNASVWLDTESRYVAQCPQVACVEYDAFGNVTKTIDTNNGETLVTYDPTYDKFPISVTNALGHVAQTSQWNVLCEAPEVVIDPNQQQTTSTYDALCRHERTDGPGGVFNESVYSGLGNPNAQYTESRSPSPDGTGYFWSRTYFDGFGRSYATESKSGESGKIVVSGEVTFNARGLVATAAQPRFDTDPQVVITLTYDPRNRLLQKTFSDANTETFSYGLDYRLHYDPEGDLTSTSRSPNGLITYLGEYLNGVPVVTTTVVDPDARTEHVYDDVGNHWITTYDSLGRPITITDPDSGTETREYDDSGLLTATVNALGQRTEFTYDLLGRVLTKASLAGTPDGPVTTFSYDQARTGYFNKGYLTRMDDAAGFEERDYDLLGRPARTKRNLDAQDYTFEFSYNQAGLPSSTVYPDSDVISWTYDAAGGLETETGTIAASTYDAAGRLVSRAFTNGVTTDVTYSQARGWVENIHTFKSGTTHQNLVYQHYADGMVESVTSPKSKESWSYSYDDLNRLTAAVNVDTPSLTQSFSYDTIGNITWSSDIGSYSYPAAGQPQPHAVTTAGSRTYAYDAAGRMTSRNGTVLNWNPDGKPSSIGNIGFTYDGVGNRLKKVSGGQTTRYLGGDYEIADDGTVTKYLAGGKKQGGSFFVHHRDHLGSIQVVSDALGAQVRRQKHKPFGDQHEVVGSHLESKGWIGEREEETELVYLNARYYDPEIGRFTAPDPIVTKGQGLNRFAYSRNSPISLFDPSGLNCATATFFNGATKENPFGDGTIASSHSTCGDEGDKSADGLYFSGWGLSPSQADALNFIYGSDEGDTRWRERQELDDYYESNPNYGPGAPTCAYTQSCGSPSSEPPADTGLQPDNPLYNCANGLKPNCPNNRAGGGALETIQVALDIASITLDATGVGVTVSWIPDLANAGISFVLGDTAGGVASLGAAIPFVGLGGNAYRVARLLPGLGLEGRIGKLIQHAPDRGLGVRATFPLVLPTRWRA